MTQIGLCTSVNHAATLHGVVDFIEDHAQNLLCRHEHETDFDAERKRLGELDIPVKAVNGFLPKEVKAIGPDADIDKLHAYAELLFSRAAKYGVKLLVFGSAKSRQIQEGMSRTAAFDQMTQLLKELAEKAAAHDLTIVLEPLSKKQCNFINSLEEGAEIVERVNHANVRLMADFYHMLTSGEDAVELLRFANLLAHIHVAETPDRGFPGPQAHLFQPYLCALKESNYTGDLCLQCPIADIEKEPRAAVSELIKQMDQAGF